MNVTLKKLLRAFCEANIFITVLNLTSLAKSLSILNVLQSVSLRCSIVVRCKFFICASLLKLHSADATVTDIVQNMRSAVTTLQKLQYFLPLGI